MTPFEIPSPHAGPHRYRSKRTAKRGINLSVDANKNGMLENRQAAPLVIPHGSQLLKDFDS